MCEFLWDVHARISWIKTAQTFACEYWSVICMQELGGCFHISMTERLHVHMHSIVAEAS